MPKNQDPADTARQEIRKLLDGLGCPRDADQDVPSWEVNADRSRWHESTGILRVKVYRNRKSKMFVSNAQGKFKDLPKIANCIFELYQMRRKSRIESEEMAAKELALEPTAERLRQEFDLSEYSGDFRVCTDGGKLELRITTHGDEDQIRFLLLRAKELGLMNPAEDGEEKTSPTIFDRINEEEDG